MLPNVCARRRKLRCAVALGAVLFTAFAAAPSFADSDFQPDQNHGNSKDPSTETPIKHVVIIFQENRSFDNYFGTYPVAANIKGE